MDHQEFAHDLHIDIARLHVFIDRGWISPLIIDGRPIFRDVDLARAELIADLTIEMGINDEGVDVVLDLLDQLYSLRFAFSKLFDALEDQPPSIRRRVVTDAQNLKRLARPGSHTLR
ncbi:chaperone modulator CbpM [Rhizobium sp. CECT 9324]|uniref:chaperone modulator CbpM n=1 Tax=Rhizobium sp. CECT 9324 TaxID=2845820 RepID=UPI001E2AFA5A|nr:chaperone modulator CbpM [Rhizobium sp. CECT 9324]CAH0342580.1 hypothetical protein RHI9324_04309 [Rhizobium sp. CECT 9324]